MKQMFSKPKNYENILELVSNDSNNLSPSVLPTISFAARSGCGIMPNTFRLRLHIPAILSIDPFGLEGASTFPEASQ
jgi:hypothetical protein